MCVRRVLGYLLGLPFGRFDFLAKCLTCVHKISHMVSSGSLLSCDAMFFSAGSQFL